jgi:threonylcarbamoyladenosine tRNA methylthiotransferase MtaB
VHSVHITTLGCKVNQCDADEMARALAQRGYRIADQSEAPDLHIINTCTVTATADAKARKLIRKLARAHPHAAIIVTGCWAQRDPHGVAALPEVDAVVPNTRKPEIADIVANFRAPDASAAISAPRRRTRAFLKIQDGCDHRCAYCAVPDARGRPVSRAFAHVVEEVRSLAEADVKEVVLCGIRLGAYGRGGDTPGLAALLRELRKVNLPRLRLSSIEPMDLDHELLAEIADHPQLCHHLHLPLQSGDDAVLAAMGREYTSAAFADLVRQLRRAWPDAALTTDVMTGFPGETEEQFLRTAGFLRATGFTRVHVFPFSSRPGTPASRRRDQVPPSAKRERTAHLLTVAQELAAKAAESWVGREVSALLEQRKDDRLTGLTEHYLRVYCTGSAGQVGEIVRLVPGRAAGGELFGTA